MNKRGTALALLILQYIVDNEESDLSGDINENFMINYLISNEKTTENESECSHFVEELKRLDYIESPYTAEFIRITDKGRDFIAIN